MDPQPLIPDYSSTALKLEDLIRDSIDRYNSSPQQSWFPGWSPAEMYAQEDKIQVADLPGDGIYRWSKEDLEKYPYDVQIGTWRAQKLPYANKVRDIFQQLMQRCEQWDRSQAILACHIALTSLALTFEVADSAPFLVKLGDDLGLYDLSLQAITDPSALLEVEESSINLHQTYAFALWDKASYRELCQLSYVNGLVISKSGKMIKRRSKWHINS